MRSSRRSRCSGVSLLGLTEGRGLTLALAFSLAQGFQVIVAPKNDAAPTPVTTEPPSAPTSPRPRTRTNSRALTQTRSTHAPRGVPTRYHDDAQSPLPGGASEALQALKGTIYVSLANLVHQIDYDDQRGRIRVMQHIRKLTYSNDDIEYEAEVWTTLATEFSSVKSTFRFPVSSALVSPPRVLLTSAIPSPRSSRLSAGTSSIDW